MSNYILFLADVQPNQSAKLKRAVIEAYQQGMRSIYIAISSGGGLISEGLNIATLLKSLPIEVITHNVGQTDSIANVIFAAGSKRYSNPDSSFLFHGANQPLNGQFSETQLKESYEGLVRLRETIVKTISTYTSIPLADISRLTVEGGKILSPTQAKAINLVSDIIPFQVPDGEGIVMIDNS